MGAILKADVCHTELNVSRYLLTGSLVDYNSWVESDKGRKLSASLDKDVVLAEGK